MTKILYFLFLSFIFSDHRSFVWTYEKIMLEPGESEVELYFTNGFPEKELSNNKNINNLTIEAEIEIGMSEDLEVSFYNVFKEEPIFNNDGSLDDLYKKVEEILAEIKE